MGLHSKIDERQYKKMMDGKLAYALQRNENDRKSCKTLNNDQHDTLAWLAEIRHDAKKDGIYGHEGWWVMENPECQELWNLLPNSESSNGEINEKLVSAGLPRIEWSFDPDDFLTDSICYELGYTEEQIEEEKENTMNMAFSFDEDIIKYLDRIDKEHGTHYSPTCMARIKDTICS